MPTLSPNSLALLTACRLKTLIIEKPYFEKLPGKHHAEKSLTSYIYNKY
jgi:hypothetical protein